MFSKDPLSDAVAGAMGSVVAVAYMEAMKDIEIEKVKSLKLEEINQRVLE